MAQVKKNFVKNSLITLRTKRGCLNMKQIKNSFKRLVRITGYYAHGDKHTLDVK
jgi:hypothetical protein